MGKIAYDREEYARAAGLLDDALARFWEAGNRGMLANMLCARSRVALAQPNAELAATLLEESLALYVALDDKAGKALALHLLGRVARQQGELARAGALFTESLRLREGGANAAILESLEELAGLTVAEEHLHVGHPERLLPAVQLLGAAATTRDVLGLSLPPGDQAAYERDVAAVRNRLDATAWHTAWAAGQVMTLEQAIAYALDESDESEHSPNA